MPRGIYDRSKLKKNKKAESTEAAPVKRGPGRPRKNPIEAAPAKAAKTPKATKATKVKAAPGFGLNQVAVQKSGDSQAIYMLSQVRENLSVLNQLHTQFGDVASIKTEVKAHIELLGTLREQVFGGDAPKASNGESAKYPQTVPMPPSVPSIPATH
jgi:hypothetical protein